MNSILRFVSVVSRVARADLQARTRSFAFLIVIACSLEFAYLFVPDARAGYLTVSIDGTRGAYNSAWMGAMCALCSVSAIAFIGFYLVRGAVTRDERDGTASIVAASPVRRSTFIAGKWLSNVALLTVLAGVLLAGCIVMQSVRAEDRSVAPGPYLAPFVFVVLPSCVFVAAMAVLFDTIRVLRGALGAAVWFVFASFAIEVPMALAASSGLGGVLDVWGLRPLTQAMTEGAQRAFPAVNAANVSIGIISGDATGVFVWRGMSWPLGVAAVRLGWTIVAGLVVVLASRLFDRFAVTAPPRRTFAWPVGRVVPKVRGLRLVRAEAMILLGPVTRAYGSIALAVGVAGALVPWSGLVSVIVPLALIAPLAVYAELGNDGRAGGIRPLIVSAPAAAIRVVVARVVTAGILGCIPLAGALLRLPALAVIPFAVAAVALALRPFARTPRAFEVLYLAIWYAGVLNHVPVADVAADALHTPVVLGAVGLLATLGASTLAVAQLRRD